jgi:hypothetical protein
VQWEDGIVGAFFEPLETKIIRVEYMASVSPEEGLLYSVVERLGNDEFNLIYYGYGHRINDSVCSSIIEVYGQKFYDHADLMGHGDFHLFEHNNKQYVLWIDQEYGSNVWVCAYRLFDITDKEQVMFLGFSKFGLDFTGADIGVYPKENGRLCTIITQYHDAPDVYRTRLYSIEDGRLDEVLDKEGRNIELFFEWDRWKSERINIVAINIPKDIKVEELSFKTVDYFLDATTREELFSKNK